MIPTSRPLVLVLLLSVAALAQFPTVPVPPGNPMNPAKILLGKALFWDEQLSSTGTVACGTCHFPEAGGTDLRTQLGGPGVVHPGPDLAFGTGDDINGSPGVIRNGPTGAFEPAAHFGLAPQVTPRKAGSVINAAFFDELFWDGAANQTFDDPVTGQTILFAHAALENQAAHPPVSDVEMGHFGITWPDAAQRIVNAKPLALASNIPAELASYINNKTYPQLFAAAFDSPAVTPAKIIMAIATYERTLVSDQAPIDNDPPGFNELQGLGAVIFDTFGKCQFCHFTNLFSDGSFRNIGVRPNSEDPGRGAITGLAADDGKFKVPSIRNVSLRAPYFHNGGKATLMDVIDFYDAGGDFPNPNQDPLIAPLGLTPLEKQGLHAYLLMFTDPRVANATPPFDRPTLYSESSHVPVTIGAGTAGSGSSVPFTIAIEPPYLENPNLTVGVGGGLGGAPAFLAIDGAANPQGQFIGFTAHLALTPALSVVPAGTLSGVGAGQGYTSMSMAIALPGSFSGFTAYGQWVVVDFGAIGGVSASEAFGMTLFP